MSATIFNTGDTVEVQVQIPGPPGPPPKLITGVTTSTLGAPKATISPVGEGTYKVDFELKSGEDGRPGSPGQPGVIANISVEMVPYTDPPSATVTGESPNQQVHLKIPKQAPTPGEPGPPGRLNTVRNDSPASPGISLYILDPEGTDVILKTLEDTASIKVISGEDGKTVMFRSGVNEYQLFVTTDQEILVPSLVSTGFVISPDGTEQAEVKDHYKARGELRVSINAKLMFEDGDDVIDPKDITVEVLVNGLPLTRPFKVQTMDRLVMFTTRSFKVQTDDDISLRVSSQEAVTLLKDSYWLVNRMF